MGKRTWTDEQIEQLKEMYLRGDKIKDIAQELNRTEYAIKSKILYYGLDKLSTRKNNINFKAVYQDYDWCYERFINLGMNMHQMAEEAKCSFRVMQKWCSEKYRLNEFTFKSKKKLSTKQKELIMFGLLGDGHIDRRENEPMYIESHAENQKDYLYWKYSILKDLCNHEPTYYSERDKIFNGKSYHCQASYRLNTRTIDDLINIRNMKRIEIINLLNNFGISIHMLDDGYRDASSWELCLAEYSQDEIELYMNICKEKLGLYCHQETDSRYIRFNANSSKKIDKIILENVPNDLDIIQYKIMRSEI